VSAVQEVLLVASFASAAALSITTAWLGMRTGVDALERMNR
jgi:hypothetical protein